MVLLDQADEVDGLELGMIVVDKDCGLAYPLAIHLAPHCLAPACVCHCQMETTLAHLLPEVGSCDVSQRVKVVVGHHLRMACGAGCEVDKGDIAVLGHSRSVKRRRLCNPFVKAYPALTLCVDNNKILYSRRLGHSLFYMLWNIVLIHSHNHLDLGRIVPEYDVLGSEHVGCRDADCTDLVQGKHGEPPLVAPLEDKHDHVTLAYSKGLEEGGSLIHILLHLGKGEVPPVSPVVDPQHCKCIGCFGSKHIHDIVGEVEVRRNIQPEVVEEIIIG